MQASSRLALFSEKFIQACWLLALIVAPLFFDIYSNRVFEPDKIALIRTLALAMGAFWLILRAERWRGRSAGRRAEMSLGQRVRAWVQHASAENPLTIPALLLFCAYVVSTALSISPTVSFFGSYQRLQGLYTFSAYLVIFFLAASQIKTRADVQRAITIALIASFPIALYGIIQHYFLDTLPWVGDVTTRVASNLGNSIFIGSFLILTIPLALARLIQSSERVTALNASRARGAFYGGALASLLVVAAAWGLAFDLGAKPFIEGNYTGTLSPEQLTLAASAFNVALLVTFVVIAGWWLAAFLLKQRAAPFLLVALYASLLAVQLVALLFSQSRGPLLGLLGGLFTFGVLLALARGARRLALIAVSAAALIVVLLALINIPNSPLATLRDLPYVGRMGRVFELEGGTGRVRVLIWQGALQLVLPHEPLTSPLTGDDTFNLIRPLVGYGPETMYVAYNKFYPPELGTLESRGATPDRSHNETFDALVNTGLLGFIAENILFLVVFYFALKWLNLMPNTRARNLFIALWFGGGILLAVLFGFIFGWEFIGVALPGGMMLGMFAYLVAFALRAHPNSNLATPSALWLIALSALFVSHFIEIHFGIAIVSTRLYFWFFAAVFVVIGTQRVSMQSAEQNVELRQFGDAKTPSETEPARRKRPTPQAAATTSARKQALPARRISVTPLISLAILVGFVLAVMGFDYINTNNLALSGGSATSGLDVVLTALTLKNTTAGGMTSLAMLWLFVTTLLLGLGICASEWGWTFNLSRRDWGVAIFLFAVLAFAIFSGLVFYHIILISVTGAGILDALVAAANLFTWFMFIVAAVCAGTMLFDEIIPTAWVSRTTNWVVAPVLIILASVLISATNISPISADIIYKQAVALSGQNTAASIELFERALVLQPQQDYYYLFLGRAYLDAAKNATDAKARADALAKSQEALNRARAINPYNTDHSANLARLAQARGALSSDPAAQIEAFKQAATYFDQTIRLSPNTAHLYDQFAQSLLDYAQVLEQNKEPTTAADVRAQAQQRLAHALEIDPNFCFTYAVRAESQTEWSARVADALHALELASHCGDVFYGEGLSIAVNELGRASKEALQANQGSAFEEMVTTAAKTNPSLEIFTTLANFYSQAGRIPDAITAVDQALNTIPAGDETTRKRYQDFRFTLVELQNALRAANAAPDNPELQRIVAQQWLARGQFNFALPIFEKIVQLKPDDYSAQRDIALVLIAQDRLDDAVPQIARAQALAPQGEQGFWKNLSAVVNAAINNGDSQAIGQLEDLAKNADKSDYALVSALRKLAEKFHGAG